MIQEIKNKNFKYGLNIDFDHKEDLESLTKELKLAQVKVSNKKYSQDKISLEITEKETEIEYFSDKSSKQEIVINIKENTRVKINFSLNGENKTLQVIDLKLNLGKNSKLEFNQIQSFENNVISFIKKEITQEENSVCSVNELTIGARYASEETNVSLNGKNAELKQNWIYLTGKNQTHNLYSCSLHNSKNTKTNILMRGAIKNNGKTLSRSLIKIKEGSINSEGYEKQEAILLDKESEAYAIPNLEIDNNQVKCSHGSTVGKIDEEKIFYLMSRGLTQEEAKNKIIEGYFNPILDKLNNDSLRKAIENKLK